MPTITFLGAAVPLTKTIHADGTKEAYPLIKNFTSYNEEIKTLEQFHKAICAHADLGHCLLKGTISRPLKNEPRAGTTRTESQTEWVCLDFDKHETPDLNDTLRQLGLGDISYIIQYSSSHGLDENMGTVSAHVFMMLERPTPAPLLKNWLMGLNLDHLARGIKLSKSCVTLRWPLDITTCQNDKLLYIAPPVFKKIKDPLQQRIKLVKRTKLSIPANCIGERSLTVLKNDERKKLNELRDLVGMPKRTAKTTWKNGIEIQNKPDAVDTYEWREQGDYIRLNINGGDSWAYWHPKDNFELIHDFKSDCYFRTQELLPTYYQDCRERMLALNSTPSEDGDLILAFRDLKTAEYYNGLYNPVTSKLELYRARNETQLDHWMRSHGRIIGDFIPTWDIQYDPRGDWTIDEEHHLINTFRPSPYMGMEPNKEVTIKDFPTIHQIIRHLLGETGKDTELSTAFLNWFAVIFQRKAKPLTAWVIHGCEGTGKGYFFNKIASQLLSTKNAMAITVGNLEDQFNGWIEGKLFILIDEIEVDDFREKGRVTAKLRNYITEPTIALRRMRQATIDAPNYASFLFSSNRPQPVYIPPTDRRYNVGNYQPKKLLPPNDEIVNAELEKFAEWLLAHRADVELANQIVQTEARSLIQKLGISSVQETCDIMKNGDFDKLWLARIDDGVLARTPVQTTHTANAQAYNLLMKQIAEKALVVPRQTLSRDEMTIILQYNVGNIRPEPNRVTSLLRHHGIETKQLRHNGNKTYGIHVDWKIGDELRAEIEEELFGKPKLRRAK